MEGLLSTGPTPSSFYRTLKTDFKNWIDVLCSAVQFSVVQFIAVQYKDFHYSAFLVHFSSIQCSAVPIIAMQNRAV